MATADALTTRGIGRQVPDAAILLDDRRPLEKARVNRESGVRWRQFRRGSRWLGGGRAASGDSLGEHLTGAVASVGRGGVEDVKVSDDDVAGLAAELDDFDGHDANVAALTDKGPTAVG